MAERFNNRYRVESARLQNWDYSWNGMYFITICTKDRACFFGDIENEQMRLSQVGVIADICWYEIKNHAKNIELGEFVVMPNHVHGILILNGVDIGNNSVETGNGGNDTGNRENGGNDVVAVEKRHAFSLQKQRQPPKPIDQNPTEPPKSIGQKRFQNQGKNTISSIIGGYKSAVTKHAHRLGFEFAWQPLFHDHIIRDDKSFHTISEYIKNNPKNWSDDKFFR